MSRRFAIGDIHGCLRTFEALLDKIQLSPNDQLYCLGDYIDRGRHSKGVLDLLSALRAKDYHITTLLGNHEQLLIEAFEYASVPTKYPVGMAMDETLESFDVPCADFIPPEYIEQLRAMPRCVLLDDYILVHAGLNFDLDNPLDDREAMIWKRHWYDHINYDWLAHRVIVHGHTPQPPHRTTEQCLQLHKIPVLDIDCGAVYAHPRRSDNPYGALCAFDLDARTLFFQENAEVVKY
jgi:serine/threonine protein phosphatase 1